MLDAVEVEVKLVGVALGPAELPAIVGQDRADRQVEVAVERHDVVVQHRHGGLGLCGDVKKPAKAQEPKGVHDPVQIHLADALQAADEEVSAESNSPGSLSTCRSRKQGLSVSRSGLLGADLDRLPRVRRLQRQPVVDAGPEAVVVKADQGLAESLGIPLSGPL